MYIDTASALGVYRAHTQRVHCVGLHAKNTKNSGTSQVVVFGKFAKRISIGEA